MVNLHKNPNLEEYFIEKIRTNLSGQNVSVSEDVEYYLVQVLKHFARADNFFHKDEKGKVQQRALAMRLYDATFEGPSKRFYHLKKLGDTALYHAGVFYDGLLNKIVDVGYYIQMGRRAYVSLAEAEKRLADLFMELSETFPDLVEVLALSCERDQLTDQDLLKWLDRYQKTKSKKAEAILREKGIMVEALRDDKGLQ